MKELIVFANTKIAEHPHLRDEINDIVSMCANEIEDGASPTHEVDLAMESINQLITL